MRESSPQGYKKTEIGIIPGDWEIVDLEEIAEVIDPHPSHRAPFEVARGIPFVGIGDLDENGNIINDSVRMVHPKILDEHKKRYNLYDNLIGLGRVASIGKVVKLKEGKYAVSPTMGIIKSNYIEWRYLYYILQFRYVIEQFNKIMTGSTRSSVGMIVLRKLKIPFPPLLEEQRAIARVLSDVDRLIESLDKLIEKKKMIKKGAMQELLTGKRRLPGFTGEWVKKKLGEIGSITGAGVDKKIRKNEIPVRLLNYMDVYKKDFLYNKDVRFNTTAPKIKLDQCSVKKGDVFFTPSSELQTDIAISAVAMEDMPGVVYSYHIVRFRLHENWDLKFRTYIFKTSKFLHQAERVAEGSGKRYVISLKKFRELEVYYPENIEEQQAIAQILSDMDAEIEALEKKKAKYEKIKKGLMEQLLTGKIRLKNKIKEVLQ
jgi:type I restriction enzyme S subunit